jgi:hypothetical protein
MLSLPPMIWLLTLLISFNAFAQTDVMDAPAEALLQYSDRMVVQTPIDLRNLGQFKQKRVRYRGTIITYSKGDRLVSPAAHMIRIELNGFSQCGLWYRDEMNGELDQLPKGSIIHFSSAVKNRISGIWTGNVSFQYTAVLHERQVGSGNLECWGGVLTPTFKIKNLIHQLSPHFKFLPTE